MQERNIKPLIAKRSSRPWFYWVNPFNYSPKKIYKDFIDVYFGFHRGVVVYSHVDDAPEIIEYNLKKTVPSKTINKPKANTIEFNLHKLKRKRSISLNLQMRKPKISSGLNFDYAIKWIMLNFKRSVKLRQPKIEIKKKAKLRVLKDFDLKRRLRKKEIEASKLKLKDHTPVTEEVIEIAPYVNPVKIDRIYQVPMVKKQINKSYISMRCLEEVRNILARHIRVTPLDIEILGVYKNFSYGMYKAIRHNAQTGNILCFLDIHKKNAKKPKKQYLLLGRKRSDGKTFTYLADESTLTL